MRLTRAANLLTEADNRAAGDAAKGFRLREQQASERVQGSSLEGFAHVHRLSMRAHPHAAVGKGHRAHAAQQHKTVAERQGDALPIQPLPVPPKVPKSRKADATNELAPALTSNPTP